MITTTHARPSTSARLAGFLSTRVTFCSRCSRLLGNAATEIERLTLQKKHRCTPPTTARQPSIAVPFS